jgi:hypothetical protein
MPFLCCCFCTQVGLSLSFSSYDTGCRAGRTLWTIILTFSFFPLSFCSLKRRLISFQIFSSLQCFSRQRKARDQTSFQYSCLLLTLSVWSLTLSLSLLFPPSLSVCLTLSHCYLCLSRQWASDTRTKDEGQDRETRKKNGTHNRILVKIYYTFFFSKKDNIIRQSNESRHSSTSK